MSLIILKLVSSKEQRNVLESYNSQTRQLERATKCSLKIDQRTDKREYPVDAKMAQEAFELLENFENWVLKFEVKTKTFSSLILNECDADGKSATEIELKSLILAQIERWRHALHMQVERQHGESWLRLNAGGMLYTCKSNGSMESLLSDGEWRTGE